MTSQSSPTSAVGQQHLVVQNNISAREALDAQRRLLQRLEGQGEDVNRSTAPTALNLVLLYASWNALTPSDDTLRALAALFREQCARIREDLMSCSLSVVSVRVDADDESIDISVGDFPHLDEDATLGLNAPSTLPAISLVRSGNAAGDGSAEYVAIDPNVLLSYLRLPGQAKASVEMALANALRESALSLASGISKKRPRAGDGSNAEGVSVSGGTLVSTDSSERALRIFVAGDRSHVGKSSVCMGLLGCLLRLNYPPSSLAYIKPATQCEATQLVAEFCKKYGIECQPIGPIVFYKGFTRSFLDGETEATDSLLRKAGNAVDEMAKGKRVVIIDGVGYPAVGSICGTDNASVARACGNSAVDTSSVDPGNAGNGTCASDGKQVRHPVPVLLVGKSGVGDAVDSFNLNSTYFESKGVPVLGAVFNRLPLDGFYSLENCKRAVNLFFAQYKPRQMPFGFIPEVSAITNSRDTKEEEMQVALANADAFVDVFSKHVDVSRILEAAAATAKEQHLQNGVKPSVSKQPKLENTELKIPPVAKVKLTREQIESAAKTAGAAGG